MNTVNSLTLTPMKGSVNGNLCISNSASKNGLLIETAVFYTKYGVDVKYGLKLKIFSNEIDFEIFNSIDNHINNMDLKTLFIGKKKIPTYKALIDSDQDFINFDCCDSISIINSDGILVKTSSNSEIASLIPFKSKISCIIKLKYVYNVNNTFGIKKCITSITLHK